MPKDGTRCENCTDANPKAIYDKAIKVTIEGFRLSISNNYSEETDIDVYIPMNFCPMCGREF